MAGYFDAHLRSLGRNKRRNLNNKMISRRAISYVKALENIRLGLLGKYRKRGKTLKEAEELIDKRIEERRRALLKGY